MVQAADIRVLCIAHVLYYLFVYCMSCISICRLYLPTYTWLGMCCGYDYARAHTKGAIFVVILIDLIFLIDRKTKGQIQNIVIHMKQAGRVRYFAQV